MWWSGLPAGHSLGEGWSLARFFIYDIFKRARDSAFHLFIVEYKWKDEDEDFFNE